MATVISPHLPEAVDIGGLLLSPSSDGRARFSRDAYHRLAEIGVLKSDKRVELIDGEIYMMFPIGPPQGSYISRLAAFFIKHLPDSVQCRVQLPIVVSDHSEPEPDLALVRHREDDYQHEHPTPKDVLLIIEVSHSSLSIDLGRKLQLYASSNIPEYWVIDVERKAILVHRGHSGVQYQQIEMYQSGSLAPVAASENQLDIDWLFR